jgi:hypothetical protein
VFAHYRCLALPTINAVPTPQTTTIGFARVVLLTAGSGTAPLDITATSNDQLVISNANITVLAGPSLRLVGRGWGTARIDVQVRDAAGAIVTTNFTLVVRGLAQKLIDFLVLEVDLFIFLCLLFVDPPAIAALSPLATTFGFPLSIVTVSVIPGTGTGPFSVSAVSNNQSVVSNANIGANGMQLNLTASNHGSCMITVTVMDAVGSTVQGSFTVTVHRKPSDQSVTI